jgi:hypothetical protein
MAWGVRAGLPESLCSIGAGGVRRGDAEGRGEVVCGKVVERGEERWCGMGRCTSALIV